ncbi:histone-lysine N-methyltransferase ASHR1-like [Planoprotostelium fungivorum]|uniref:Histone-lysine N-methyltransferase ASHR1-like n=1 Tax=Planoprotostelium fungivorum TaxID=1890364 RepID=A0A2P6NLE5_9EUKA|nr:histone-lysine N-methyltransferase ASHR1-like [Planoprotostelium fungivorum]
MEGLLEGNHDVSLEQDEVKGRTVISKRSLQPGDIVLHCQPLVAVPNAENHQLCSRCFRQAAKPLRCSRCKMIFYCGSNCQKKDWTSFHKRECPLLAAVHSQIVPPTIRLLGRLAIAMVDRPSSREVVDHMMDHRGKWTEKQMQVYAQMSVFATQYLSPDEGLRDLFQHASHMIRIFCIFSCNNFNVSDQSMNHVGIGLYPEAALINHSCDCNSVATFSDGEAFIRSVKHIPPGQEITINYIELASSKENRNSILSSNFHFVCHCDLCQSGGDRDARLSQPSCNKCRRFLKREEGAYRCKVCAYSISSTRCDDVMDKCRNMSERGATDHVPSLRSALKEGEEVFGIYNEFVILLKNRLIKMSIEGSQFQEATLMSESLLEAYEYLYPSYWPLLGLQLFMHAKLLRLEENCDLKRVSEILRRAHSILMSSHGRCKLTLELDDLCRETEAELNHRR